MIVFIHVCAYGRTSARGCAPKQIIRNIKNEPAVYEKQARFSYAFRAKKTEKTAGEILSPHGRFEARQREKRADTRRKKRAKQRFYAKKIRRKKQIKRLTGNVCCDIINLRRIEKRVYFPKIWNRFQIKKRVFTKGKKRKNPQKKVRNG